MDPTESAQLIELAGGTNAFAQLLGITNQPRYMQRVSNWKRRGIPARVVLDHQGVIESLRRRAKSAA